MKKSEYYTPTVRLLRIEWSGAILTGSYGNEGGAGSNPGQNNLGGF